MHAANLLQLPATECWYVGDDERDIIAANAAGMRGLVAMYGYLGAGTDPKFWPAAAWVESPADILAMC